MERHYFGLATLLASVALLIWSIGETFAFPQGPNVSMGSNPLFSYGGKVNNSQIALFTAPSSQSMVVTDLILSMKNSNCLSTVELTTSGGDLLSSIDLHSRYVMSGNGYAASATQTSPSLVQHSFSSGIPLALGETLEMNENGGCDVSYTVSGYYAHQ